MRLSTISNSRHGALLALQAEVENPRGRYRFPLRGPDGDGAGGAGSGAGAGDGGQSQGDGAGAGAGAGGQSQGDGAGGGQGQGSGGQQGDGKDQGDGQGDPPPPGATDAERKAWELERDNKKYRDELKELRAWREEQEAKGLTESQALERRATKAEETVKTLETTTRELAVELAVTREAAALGITDTEAAVVLLEKAGSLTFGEDGRPTNARKALEALVKAKPYLTTPVVGQGGGGGQGAGDGRSTFGATAPARGAGGDEKLTPSQRLARAYQS